MRGQKGLTLLEILISLGIMSIMIVIVYTILQTGINLWGKQEGDIEGKQSVLTAISLISQEIRNGYKVEIVEPVSGNSREIIIYVRRNGTATRKIKYSLNSAQHQIQRAVNDNGSYEGNNIVARGITRLWFERAPNDSNLIKVSITFQGKKQEYSFSTGVFIRNSRTKEGS